MSLRHPVLCVLVDIVTCIVRLVIWNGYVVISIVNLLLNTMLYIYTIHVLIDITKHVSSKTCTARSVEDETTCGVNVVHIQPIACGVAFHMYSRRCMYGEC